MNKFRYIFCGALMQWKAYELKGTFAWALQRASFAQVALRNAVQNVRKEISNIREHLSRKFAHKIRASF